MNQLLENIAKSIVDNSQEVRVEQTEQNGFVHLTLHVHPDDIGRVIGKEGKIITAIRNLLRVAAIRKGKRVRVELAEPERPKQPEAQSEVAQEMSQEETPSNQEPEPENKEKIIEPEIKDQID